MLLLSIGMKTSIILPALQTIASSSAFDICSGRLERDWDGFIPHFPDLQWERLPVSPSSFILHFISAENIIGSQCCSTHLRLNMFCKNTLILKHCTIHPVWKFVKKIVDSYLNCLARFQLSSFVYLYSVMDVFWSLDGGYKALIPSYVFYCCISPPVI